MDTAVRQLAVVELLFVRSDVDPDPGDEDGRTTLSWAAEEGYEAVVKLLLSPERIISKLNEKSKRTPLFRAISNGNMEVVQLLLEVAGVDLEDMDENGRTLLSW